VNPIKTIIDPGIEHAKNAEQMAFHFIARIKHNKASMSELHLDQFKEILDDFNAGVLTLMDFKRELDLLYDSIPDKGE